MALRSLKVVGIFERQDVAFDFSSSPFFLVGPNGTGKTTALKVLHLVLSGQWSRLDTLPFIAVEITIDDSEYLFEKADFGRIERLLTYLSRTMRRPIRRGGPTFPKNWETARAIIEGRHPQSRRNIRIPSNFDFNRYAEDYDHIVHLCNAVESDSFGRVLYFPTYRRVERDLGELLEYDEPEFEDGPSIAPAVAGRFQQMGEVIGFGGQDIRQLLANTASSIEVEARRALNEHSVRFLEALATKKTEQTKKARALIRSGERTSNLLDRLSAFSPSGINIDAIRTSIDALRIKLSRRNPGRLTQQQDMLLFYVSEMITLLDRIDELSEPLIDFVETIDKYMKPVKTAYLRHTDNRVVISDRNQREIELDQLSSGEKQIVSFFAFLFLRAGNTPRYIIIDEPELSLSVSWQKTLIKDLQDINKSSFISVATHSPFIFENFSLDYVESLGDL